MFQTSPRPPGDAPPGDHAGWLGALDRLAAILDGCDWLLAGGLAIPLTLGSFHRNHRDIDIVFPCTELGRVDDAMRVAGYRLTTRVSFHLGRRHVAALLPLRGRGFAWRLRPRKLRFVPRRRGEPAWPPHVDVMPYDVVGGCIAPRNMPRRVPITEPLEGHRAVLPSGREIGVLALHYVRALMRRPDLAKHRVDRERLDEALAYRSRTTAGPPFSSTATSHIA